MVRQRMTREDYRLIKQKQRGFPKPYTRKTYTLLEIMMFALWGTTIMASLVVFMAIAIRFIK